MAEPKTIFWQTQSLDVVFHVDADGKTHLFDLRQSPRATNGNPAGDTPLARAHLSALPINAVRLVGEGNTTEKTTKTLIGSYVSSRLKYQSHETKDLGERQCLDITSADELTKIKVINHFVVYHDVPVLRSTAEIYNGSDDTVIVTQLSSVTIGGLSAESTAWWQDSMLYTATNSWFREAQWREHTMDSIGISDNSILRLADGHTASMAHFSLANRGSFSTGTYLPMGMLGRNDDKETWLWQVESSGSWRWEVGDYKDDVYLCAGGPTAIDHDWKEKLLPGESFTSVPVAVCHMMGSRDSAFGALTQYRRRIRRAHADNERMNLIFNDYMNCLMGDPDENKIRALLPAVVQHGAEYFVMDCGWYADDSGWWDDVGLWEPSKLRFPSGFKTLLDEIRSNGLVPGVWLEPEVIGVRSVANKQLPDEAFFQECGHKILERGRYQLDYRHTGVRERMDRIIDHLVLDHGVGYFKFDYNIEVVQGTDLAFSSGSGFLNHNRAYLDWVNGLYDRHPDLVIESCSSGALRMDYAMLSIHSMQSTSDQQDPILYAAIAAAVPSAVTPEQSATWAYPQGEWSDETNALTVTNTLLGRVHLSGRLDHLNSTQTKLVSDGMQVYKTIRQSLRTALPFWPLGLPKWHDEWLTLGMTTAQDGLLLTVWRRGGPLRCDIPIAQLGYAQRVSVELLYPKTFKTEYGWNALTSSLSVELPGTACARLFRLKLPAETSRYQY